LTTSLDLAEQQIQERLKKNLDVYHDLKKLRAKPREEFTTQDLDFVKNQLCKDDKCFGGAQSLYAAAATLTVSLCLVTLI